MRIQLTKGTQGQAGTLACFRDDGSRSWQPSSDYFARHDLIHYAVETTLNYREAFFGRVAQGKDLDAYGTRNGVKGVYTDEEVWAESVVGALQWPVIGGGPELQDAEFLAMLAQSGSDAGRAAPTVTPEQIADIRARIGVLHAQWDALPEGETLELTF